MKTLLDAWRWFAQTVSLSLRMLFGRPETPEPCRHETQDSAILSTEGRTHSVVAMKCADCGFIGLSMQPTEPT